MSQHTAQVAVLGLSFICPTPDCSTKLNPIGFARDLLQGKNEIRCRTCGERSIYSHSNNVFVVENHPDIPVEILQSHQHQFATDFIVDGDIDDFQYEEEPYHPHDIFKFACDGLHTLSDASVQPYVTDLLNRVIFQQYITLLEAYLSDTFIRIAGRDDKALTNIVLKTNYFEDETASYKAIAADPNFLRRKVIERLKAMSWHDLNRAEKVCNAVFGIPLYPDAQIKERLNEAVKKRHDLVHRNGRTKDDEAIVITKRDLITLSIDVNKLVEHVSTGYWQWYPAYVFGDVKPLAS